MFYISVKSNRLKAVTIALVTVALCLAVVFSIINGLRRNRVMLEDGDISYRASDSSERIAFFSQFGWEISEEPVGVKEIVIPEIFDDEYKKYNELQKKQGLDLENYKGEKVKRWTYQINNYPGMSLVPGDVTGSIIVYKGAVIGGDISSASPEKPFSGTFDYPSEAQTQNNGKSDAS